MNKNTVFVWDGILEARAVNDDGHELYWHGVVVANDNASQATSVPEPPRNAFKEFVDSDLQFEVKGIAQPLDGNMKDNNKFKPFLASFQQGSGAGWDFGGQKNHDIEHEVLLNSLLWKGSPDQRESLVYARGKGEHGSFISVGWMRPGNRVTLARRYVNDNDPRAKWTTKQVRDAILGQIYDDEEDTLIMPPWKCHALNA